MNSHASLPTSAEDGFDRSTTGTWRLFWVVLFIASFPWQLAYLSDLWRLEHYRFFPFAVGITGWLIYTRWDRAFRAPRGLFAWSAIAFCVVTVAAASYARSPWMGALGFASVLLAFCFSSQDRRNHSSLVALTLPVLLTLRLPLNYDQILVVQLQRLTTTLSSVVLDLIAIPHAVSNNVIQLASRELFVAEACSGIQSVFTLMFLAVAIVALNRRPIWSTPFYIAISVVLAVVTNVLRVCTIAMADSWMSLDLATGWQHELVGYAALGIGILLLMSFDQFIRTMIHPIHQQSSRGNPLLLLWDYFVGDDEDDIDVPVPSRTTGGASAALWHQPIFRYGVIGFCGVLALASTVQAIRLDFMNDAVHYLGSEEILFRPDPGVFDQSTSSLVVSGHETSSQSDNPRLGANADIWTCKVDGLDREVQVVLSQPYVEWHELCFCYENIDGLLLHRDVVEADETIVSMDEADSSTSNAYAIARFKQPGNVYGYLIYSALTPDGRIVHPPALAGSLQNRFGNLFTEAPTSEVMMFQLFVSLEGRIDNDQLSKMKTDFQTMRLQLQNQIRSSANP